MSLCWLFCCPPLPSFIINKLAFLPPAPTYSLEESPAGLRFVSRIFPSHWLRDAREVEAFWATTTRGSRLACLHLRCAREPRFTLLMSQGNSEDLGLLVASHLQLAQRLACDVVGYDYSGYGVSSGSPSERNAYADVEAVWRVLRDARGVVPSRLVLYGYSLGTAPTVRLAARLTDLAGVVLHAPFTSALRLAFPNLRRTWCCDAFNNVDRIEHVRAPVLVVHGTRDSIVDVSHGMELHSRCADPVRPLWLDGADHHDVCFFDEYWSRLEEFLVELEARAR